jgi:UDP-GlcNAc:undecaprenyl-phosphate/decaprenyl-phosphate GlcNAc-1-phosphate transferase
MNAAAWTFVVALPAIATAVLIALLRRSAIATAFVDVPNQRSLHDAPVPRIGGTVLIPVALAVASLFADRMIGVILGCALFLAIVSMADDHRSLPIEVRLPAHFAAAMVAILAIAAPGAEYSGGYLVLCIAAALSTVWITNAYNFMDGSDGLAGGMAVTGFAALALGALTTGQAALAVVCAAIASAALGFLFHNFPPAKVFLGDAGSVPLGFLAGALGWLGFAWDAWPIWFPALAFAPFLVDATLTLTARMLRVEPFWKAHRSHAYQRLVLAGWSHARLARYAYGLMIASAAAALMALRSGGNVRLGILLGSATVYVLLFTAIEARLRRTTTRGV